MKLNSSTKWTVLGGLVLGLLAGFVACAPPPSGGNNNTNENDNTGTGDPSVIFPENYAETYREVRDCRGTVEHSDPIGVFSIRVLASPDAEEAYLNEATIPAGGVIVKEEFSDFDCQVIVQYRPMKKEAPGFDPARADWHYQKVTASRQILEDSPASCIGCHSEEVCVQRDYMCTECPCPNE